MNTTPDLATRPKNPTRFDGRNNKGDSHTRGVSLHLFIYQNGLFTHELALPDLKSGGASVLLLGKIYNLIIRRCAAAKHFILYHF